MQGSTARKPAYLLSFLAMIKTSGVASVHISVTTDTFPNGAARVFSFKKSIREATSSIAHDNREKNKRCHIQVFLRSPQASDEYNENVLTQAAKRHPEILMSNVSPFGEPLPIKISGFSARPEAMTNDSL